MSDLQEISVPVIVNNQLQLPEGGIDNFLSAVQKIKNNFLYIKNLIEDKQYSLDHMIYDMGSL